MAREQHYSPRISRFLVSVLYHEARHRGIPMTRLADELLRRQLTGSKGWATAEELKVAEQAPPYPGGNR